MHVSSGSTMTGNDVEQPNAGCTWAKFAVQDGSVQPKQLRQLADIKSDTFKHLKAAVQKIKGGISQVMGTSMEAREKGMLEASSNYLLKDMREGLADEAQKLGDGHFKQPGGVFA